MAAQRRKGATRSISRAFWDGMREAAPQEIHTIDVIDRHIEFCRGCFACKYNGSHCVLDYDMREILGQIPDSDLLLFRCPLYCYGMPAMLKNLVDRMLPLSSMAMEDVNGRYVHVGQRDFSRLRYLRHHRTIRRRVGRCLFRHLRHENSSIYLQ